MNHGLNLNLEFKLQFINHFNVFQNFLELVTMVDFINIFLKVHQFIRFFFKLS